MQHEHHRVPVTALAFFRGHLLSGEGTYLKVYSGESKLLKSVHIFERQAIHGIAIVGSGHTSISLVWGGPRVRPVLLKQYQNGDIDILTGDELATGDWILDAAFATLTGSVAAIVTAHNALSMVQIHSQSTVLKAALQRLVPGSNCILYSAHLTWLSPLHCLIASGTAFGDITIWSAYLNRQHDGTAENQIHYSFSAHEGSVFGVRISSQFEVRGLEAQRVLASCSDDRTVRLWDISELLSASSLTLGKEDLDTGFGKKSERERHTPKCLAKTMAHISRIWHIRFLNTRPNGGSRRIWSFGEDASVIAWNLRAEKGACVLQQVYTQTAHSGKNIWSVAVGTDILATGGADGAIALYPTSGQDCQIVDVPRSLLSDLGSKDNFRAYGFVAPGILIFTTDHGRVVRIDLSESSEQISVEDVSTPLLGLKGYSFVASIPQHAFLGGTDGTVYHYISKQKRVEELGKIDGKIAGLFAYRYTLTEGALLATSVGGASAALFLFDPETLDELKMCTKTIGLSLATGFITTSFAHCVEQQSSYAILGSRQGSIAFYRYCPDNDEESLQCSKLLTSTHGKEAVTALEIKQATRADNGPNAWLYSTGRDGTFCVHSVHLSDHQIDLELVHQLSLPFGPNIEGFHITSANNITIWGFKRTLFIAYNLNTQLVTMSVECGGAHRNWAFQPSDTGAARFVWTQASRLYHAESNNELRMIKSGGHGREIKAIAISSGLSQQIIATGAEDTDIKLFTLDNPGFTCLRTLRKHNTGLQHLRFHGSYLFSSGGFEEFFVWKISEGLPYIGIGVVCESKHPRSGGSDLRVMGFEVAGVDVGGEERGFGITMAYSDSTVKIWWYGEGMWELRGGGDYLTACLTNVVRVGGEGGGFVSTATDGHVALWTLGSERGLKWVERHKVHQSTIHSVQILPNIADGTSLIITGGDDNALAISLLHTCRHTKSLDTLIVPRAHAAAVTGLAILPTTEGTGIYWLATAGIDQQVKLWRLDVDVTKPGVEGVEVRRLGSAFTAVADVSGLEVCVLEDGGLGVLVVGVGMDLWRVREGELEVLE